MKKKVMTILNRIFLSILLVVGLFILFSNHIQHYLIQSTSDDLSLSNVDREQIIENQRNTSTNELTFDFDSVDPITTQSVLMEYFTKNNHDYPVIAGIAVPAVDINLPIFMGLANEHLLWGAGTLSESQEMGTGNYALASHLSHDPEALFSPLVNIEMDDAIYLNDLENIFVYHVSSIETVDSSAVHVLNESPGEAIVTLITCTEFDGRDRLIIQGHLTQMIPVDDVSDEIMLAFQR